MPYYTQNITEKTSAGSEEFLPEFRSTFKRAVEDNEEELRGPDLLSYCSFEVLNKRRCLDKIGDLKNNITFYCSDCGAPCTEFQYTLQHSSTGHGIQITLDNLIELISEEDKVDQYGRNMTSPHEVNSRNEIDVNLGNSTFQGIKGGWVKSRLSKKKILRKKSV